MNPWYHKLLFKRPKITIRSECARFLELFAQDLVQSALVETAALEDADGSSHLLATLGLVLLSLQNVNQPRSGERFRSGVDRHAVILDELFVHIHIEGRAKVLVCIQAILGLLDLLIQRGAQLRIPNLVQDVVAAPVIPFWASRRAHACPLGRP